MELSAANVKAWLTGHDLPAEDAVFQELGGGVSNTVILIESADFRAILKQSLGQLRVEQEWRSSRGRVLREAAVMRWLSPRISSGRIPGVLLEDPEEFAILMEAAPAGVAMWKTDLLEGALDAAIAAAAGRLLASVISVSWDDGEARELFADQTVFDELRIDPYYRFTARRHPEIAGYFEKLMGHSAARKVSLVHGDFSPKNLLVDGGEVWAIDWEVVHFGDPSFDVAFLWNHLLLKSIFRPECVAGFAQLAEAFTTALNRGLPAEACWIGEAALEHLPALLLARVDGKSPAEYLDETMRVKARALALGLIARPALSIGEVFAR